MDQVAPRSEPPQAAADPAATGGVPQPGSHGAAANLVPASLGKLASATQISFPLVGGKA